MAANTRTGEPKVGRGAPVLSRSICCYPFTAAPMPVGGGFYILSCGAAIGNIKNGLALAFKFGMVVLYLKTLGKYGHYDS